MSVKFSGLPYWAQFAINNTSIGSMVNISRGGHSLSIANDVAVFDGQLVSETEEFEVETVNFSELPLWAQLEVNSAGKGGIHQFLVSGDSLQINGPVVRYNGKLVIKK